MAIIVDEIAKHPVYDEDGQHDETFVNLKVFHLKTGHGFASLRVLLEDLEEGVEVGDEVKLVIARKPQTGPRITQIDANEAGPACFWCEHPEHTGACPFVDTGAEDQEPCGCVPAETTPAADQRKDPQIGSTDNEPETTNQDTGRG